MNCPLTIFRASALLLLLSACGGNTGSNQDAQTQEVVEPWEIDFQMAQAKEDDCQKVDCARAFFGIPMVKGGAESVRSQINSDIDALVRESIKARLPEPMSQASFESLAEAFVEGYELFKMEFPDAESPWFFEIQGSRSSFTADYFILHLFVSEFMGGAHPNSYTVLQNYSLSTGELVDVRELYDEGLLKKHAEAAFREKHKLTAGAPLDDEGFMFPDGQFVLPDNMAITENGILLIYDSYEVASYAVGSTEILLPLDLEAL